MPKSDIILINKPSGMTSFDVIRRLSKKFPATKIGHAGTLDPLAEGLLIIGIGPGVKKLSDFLKLPKTYDAEILLGIETDTGDLEGKILRDEPVPIDDKTIRESIIGLNKGLLKLPAPLYSALKVKGKPLYWYARNGKEVTVPEKLMDIRSVAMHDIFRKNGKVVVSLTLNVGSGTYIRSIACEIGRRLGVPATLQSLVRTKIGNFTLEEAETL